MTQLFPPMDSESWKLSCDHEITSIFVSHPFLLVFGGEVDYANVWRLRPAGPPEHVTELSDIVPLPERDNLVILDPERQVLIMRFMTAPSIAIFSLVDGTLLDFLSLQGSFMPWAPQYLRGQLLLGRVETGESSVQEHTQFTYFVTICKWTNDHDTSTVHHLCLSNETHIRSHVELSPLLLTSSGDIIASVSESYSDIMKLLRWRGPYYMAGQEPEVMVTLPICFANAGLKAPESTASMDEDKFLLCTRELALDTPIGGRTSQMVVYALDTRSLAIHWKAEPIWGNRCKVYKCSAVGVVIAIGENYEMDSPWSQHKVTWIVILHVDTGACLRQEFVDHKDVGSSVIQCTISQDTDIPSLIIVFEDADYIALDLREFVERGLSRHADDGSLVVKRAAQSPAKVERAVVGDGVIIMSFAATSEEPEAVHVVSWMLGVSF
jgi:hypothetical protein